MTVKIIPHKLKGKITAISSKSDAHRLMICAALSDDDTHLVLNAVSEDINATARCLESLGSKITRVKDGFVVSKISRKKEIPILDCGESGSTLRFLIPVACSIYDNCRFVGSKRLMERPLTPLLNELKNHGVNSNIHDNVLDLKGRLRSGTFSIAGNISSQYISGLMFAIPVLKGSSEISLTTPLESKGYVDMTLDSMKRFGIGIKQIDNKYCYNGVDKYTSPREIIAEGDWSNAAFWYGAAALGSEILIDGVREKSLQGDKRIKQICKEFGVLIENDKTIVNKFEPFVIDAKDIPDLVPILSIIACGMNKKTIINGTARLRLKESDRVESTLSLIKNLGGHAFADNNSITIDGNGVLTGGAVDGYNDHRIVMSAAIASTICKEPVIINDAQAINKSYPLFFEHFKELGGIVSAI